MNTNSFLLFVVQEEASRRRRLTNIQATAWPGHLWTEIWSVTSKAAQRREKQQRAIEKPKLDSSWVYETAFGKDSTRRSRRSHCWEGFNSSSHYNLAHKFILMLQAHENSRHKSSGGWRMGRSSRNCRPGKWPKSRAKWKSSKKHKETKRKSGSTNRQRTASVISKIWSWKRSIKSNGCHCKGARLLRTSSRRRICLPPK